MQYNCDFFFPKISYLQSFFFPNLSCLNVNQPLYSLATGSSGCLHLIHFSFTLFASAERLHNKWTHWHLESSTEVQWSCFHMHFLAKCHSARACLGALTTHMEPGLFWRLSRLLPGAFYSHLQEKNTAFLQAATSLLMH